MESGDAIQIISLILLLLLSAFFSSAETALTTVSQLRIRQMLDENVRGARTLSKLLENRSKLLSTILVGNNLVNILSSALATTLSIKLFGNYAVGIATGVLTVLVLIFGEITPKTVASVNAEKMSLRYAPVLLLLTRLLTPVTFLINKLASLFILLFGVDLKKQKDLVTEKDLRSIVEVSHEVGVIEHEERQMITNVVDFGDSYAKDVMIPRIDMVFASTDMTYEELLKSFRRHEYTRMPVFNEDKDDIVGIVNQKDIFLNYKQNTPFDIRNFLRPAHFTYEYKKTSTLMNEMREKRIPISIVLDEYGAVAGLVTLEDLLEEIVGEIRDEYDTDEVDPVKKVSDNRFICFGSAKLDEINETCGLNLESDDYDSVAGHIISLLGHIPVRGEEIRENNVVYKVISVKKNRVHKLSLTIEEPQGTEEEKDREE